MRPPHSTQILQRQNRTISNLKEFKGSPTWLGIQSLKWYYVTITTPGSSFHTRWSKPLLHHRCSSPYSISWPSTPLVPRAAWRWMNWLLRYTLPRWLAAVPLLPEYLAALLFPSNPLSAATWASLLPKPTHTHLEKLYLVVATLLDQLRLFNGWGLDQHLMTSILAVFVFINLMHQSCSFIIATSTLGHKFGCPNNCAKHHQNPNTRSYHLLCSLSR